MSKAVKAALLSGLVIPGAGHLYLKSHWRGLALIIVVLGTLTAFVMDASRQASSILEKIEAEGGLVDISRIIALATQSTNQAADSPMITIATTLLIGCWILGMVDAYRLGRQH